MKQELCNTFLFKQDKYPKTIVEALGLLKNYVPGPLAVTKVTKDEGEKRRELLAFVEAGGASAASMLVCFLCGNKGHKAKQCTVVSVEKKREYLAKHWGGFPRGFGEGFPQEEAGSSEPRGGRERQSLI